MGPKKIIKAKIQFALVDEHGGEGESENVIGTSEFLGEFDINGKVFNDREMKFFAVEYCVGRIIQDLDVNEISRGLLSGLTSEAPAQISGGVINNG